MCQSVENIYFFCYNNLVKTKEGYYGQILFD